MKLSTERQQRIREKLRIYLGREPKENEKVNAENDHILVTEILLEEVDQLKKEVENIKNIRPR